MYAHIETTVTAIVCLLTAFVIQRIYDKEQKRQDLQTITGIKWFGLAIFAWGIGAFVTLVSTKYFEFSASSKWLIYWSVFISLINSLFILLSLPSIEHQKERNMIVRIVERFSVKEFMMLFGGIFSMIAFVFIATSYNNQEISNTFIWLIDIPISLVVALALLYELNKAFANRNMKFMYLPCFSLFILIVIAVSHRIIPHEMVQEYINLSNWSLLGIITALSFKFIFILLFSILLYSWKFLSEKEQQQSEFVLLEKERNALRLENEKLKIANESHIDTIQSITKKLDQKKKKVAKLQEASKIVLSDRQKEVLANLGLCGAKKSYTEIAEAMHISVDGFQAHIYQIKKILNISGSAGKEQLIVYAIENDLLQYATVSCD
jgi:DNA-binding CsgD family transcriptional regulator